MRISIHSGDFPQGELLTNILKLIKQIGVTYVELPFGETFVNEKNVKNISQILREYNLRACCIDNWCYFLESAKVKENQKLIFKSIQVAKELKVNFIRVGPFGSIRSQKLKEATKEYKKNIMPCLKTAKSEKIVLLLENEFGDDPTRKASQCLEILEYIGSDFFKLLYDPCNFYIAGEEPYPYAYSVLKNNVGYIHLKDAYKIKEWGNDDTNVGIRGDKELCMYIDSNDNLIWKDRDNPSDYLCVSLEQGGINYNGLISALKKDRYDGFVSLEPHVKAGIHTGTIKQSIQYLKSRGVIL